MNEFPLVANRESPSLPEVGDDLDGHTRILRAVRECVMIGERRTKNLLSSFVRVSEIVDLGIAEVQGGRLVVATVGDVEIPVPDTVNIGIASATTDITSGSLATTDLAVVSGLVFEVQVYVTVPFDDGGAFLTVGTAADHDALFTAADSILGVVGNSVSQIGGKFAADTQLSVYLTPGASSVGEAWVSVIYQAFDDITAVSGGGGGGSGTVTSVGTGAGLTGGPITSSGTVALNAASIASLALADTAVQPARQVNSGTGLTGGGNLSADRTLALNAASQASLALADTAVQPAGLSGYALSANIQTFAVGGASSWSRPTGGKITEVYCVAGGGGGGSGRLGSAGVARGGGGGGQGGGRSFSRFITSDLASSVSLSVGAGGGGVAARTTTNNGVSGTDGNPSTFGSGPILVRAEGGSAGVGATGSGGSGGSSNGIGSMSTGGTNATNYSRGQSGGTGGSTGAGSAGTSQTSSEPTQACGGGGGGGGVSAANAAQNGGAGSSFPFYSLTGAAGGTAPSNPGTPGSTWGGSLGAGGGAGGGAGASIAGSAAGNGTAGAVPGGGGGGGGAGTESGGAGQSGAGGTGGDGVIVVITYF